MRYYLLVVASTKQIAKIKNNLLRYHANPISDRAFAECFQITHPSLQGIELRLHLLAQMDAIISHLRHHPVDLLIYDERQAGMKAVEAFEIIKADVTSLAKLWGPDFHFPLSRSVAILNESRNAAHDTFLLGRDNVRDVLVSPRTFAQTLRWIAKLLINDHKRNEYKTGIALSGGGMEGFLYQVGCLYALDQALQGKSLYDCDILSGISSGSIAAASIGTKIPIQELVKAIAGKSDTLPSFKGKMLYDLAVKDIFFRFLKQSISFKKSFDPNNWLKKSLKSIPTGFFKGDEFKKFLKESFEKYESDDSFTSLDKQLYIGATNQDTFEHKIFGNDINQSTSISDAVRASCALPPFFTPCKIENELFIDGMVTRSCNLELVVKKGCNLIFIIDPMKPYTSWEPGTVDQKGGYYTMVQTIKTLVSSRFQLALEHVTSNYHNVDFMIFQPMEECAKAMAGSPMKYNLQPELVQLAFKGTLQRLRERHSIYEVKLQKYGFQLASQRQLLELERNGIEFL